MNNNEIAENQYYADILEQSKSLETRLDKISLSDEEITRITRSQSMKAIKEKGLPLLGPLGEIASTVIGWSDEVNEELEKAKEKKLLLQYFEKTDEQLGTIDNLKDFVTNPFGFILFNKIRGILSDAPLDSDLVDHLSSVLKNIIQNGHFESLFEKYKYVLNQIEKVTPQGLTILADCDSWPTFSLNASTYFGGKVSSEFHKEFAEVYASSKGIHAEEALNRITHSIRELQTANLLEAYKIEEKGKCECRLTEVGTDVVRFLK